MNTIKTLTILSSLLLIMSCSSDDDNASNNSQQQTEDFLTASKWYQESRTPDVFTDCEKNTSFQFNTDNTIIVESFDDDSGTCEPDGALTATYTLSGTTITISFGLDTITATINSISASMLTITNDVDEIIVFDKTQG